MSSRPKKRNNKLQRQRRGRNTSQSVNQHLLERVDLELALADGSVLPRQDGYETRAQSAVPPINVPRALNQQLFWGRWIVSTSFTLSAVAETDRGFAFHLNDFGNYTRYTGLFDQYAIVCIVATFGATYNSVNAGSAAIPRMYSVIDHDDAAPTAISAITLNPSVKSTHVYRRQTRMIYPRAATAAYSGAFTSFANQRVWVDSGSPSVEHYGLKISSEIDASASVIDVDFTYYVVFRNVHNA